MLSIPVRADQVAVACGLISSVTRVPLAQVLVGEVTPMTVELLDAPVGVVIVVESVAPEVLLVQTASRFIGPIRPIEAFCPVEPQR